MSASLSPSDDDERVAVSHHVTCADHYLGHYTGYVGQHGDLHLHRIQKDQLLPDLDSLINLNGNAKNVRNQFCGNHVTHGTNARGLA